MRKSSAKKNKKNSVGQIDFRKYKIANLKEKFSIVSKRINPKQHIKQTLLFIQRKPFTSFFTVLIVLTILMIIGNVFFSPKVINTQNETAPKTVRIFKLGSAPQITYQGKIEKSGVIKIVAQMPGIVSYVNVSEGQEISQGTNILSLSTNYQGGNALTLARQLAQTQYQNAKDSYDAQKDLIQKQKDLADKNRDNVSQMRDIANASATDSGNLVSYNQSIVDSLNQSLQSIPATDSAAILQIKGMIAQYQSAITQMNASIRNLQYQGASDKPPADLANIQHDITIKQLNLQQKSLDMSLEISRLSYSLALVNEANMYPTSPFAGTVDKIFVHTGDTVSPGMTLASLSGNNQHVEIVVNVPENIAKNISAVEPSVLEIGDSALEMRPSYVSKDATSGVLYSVIYQLDDNLSGKLTNASYIIVRIPIGIADTSNADPYIPLDAVVQTQENAFVYIVDNKMTARAKKIKLGQIQGGYVEALSGLSLNSQVILNRNVIEGDKIRIER